MATFYPVGGGAPGIDPSVLTATAGDVVAGMVAGVKDNYNPVTGTLTLTGNAQQNHVLSGETYYTTNPKSKITGTMTVQSILSFSSAPYSANQIAFTWQNPSSGPFSGVIIIGKTGGYPANISDGTRYYKGFGNNSNANGISTTTVSGFSSGVTYYFRAFSYSTINSQETTSNTTRTSNTIINIITRTFSSSTTWTVPSNVHSVTVFLVGGGGSGSCLSTAIGGGGGGGGRTGTGTISVTPNQNISIIIGTGGARVSSVQSGNSGTSTSFGTFSVSGGNGGDSANGGNGGSGGGGGANWYYDDSDVRDTQGASGGSNGGNGGNQPASSSGIGQGITTRAFGESSGTLYAGGGGGGSRGGRGAQNGGAGGSGGGGAGGAYNISGFVDGQAGGANTGGGGGGNGSSSSGDNDSYYASGAGGSGICIIRYIG